MFLHRKKEAANSVEGYREMEPDDLLQGLRWEEQLGLHRQTLSRLPSPHSTSMKHTGQ